jgi:hypothetical protein
MRARLFAASALAATSAALAQEPWMNVRSWSGTVTVEVTDTRKNESYSSKTTFRAAGPFTISDDMLPAGNHVQWPMPGVEVLSDPAKAQTAWDTWQAHLTGTHETKGADESGKPFSGTCTADEGKASKVSLAIDPTSAGYVFHVSVPQADFTCPPRIPPPGAYLQQVEFDLKGEHRTPGRLSGSKIFPAANGTVKVSYEMAPSK